MNTNQNENKEFSGVCCPNCGEPIPKKGGAFCTNCGGRLFSAGGTPSVFNAGMQASPKRMKNNAYGNYRAVGFGTHWHGTKTEIILIWASALIFLVSIIAGAVLGVSTGNFEYIFIGAVIGIAVVFLAFIISLLNPSHRKEQKENMFRYGGKINYTASQFTGIRTDKSEMNVEKVYNDDE